MDVSSSEKKIGALNIPVMEMDSAEAKTTGMILALHVWGAMSSITALKVSFLHSFCLMHSSRSAGIRNSTFIFDTSLLIGQLIQFRHRENWSIKADILAADIAPSALADAALHPHFKCGDDILLMETHS